MEQKMEQEQNIGHRIRIIMGNLTLQEFSSSIEVTIRALSNYLSGRVPRKTVLQKICSQYGVLPEWLLTGRGPMYSGGPIASAARKTVTGCHCFIEENQRVLDLQHIENKNKLIEGPVSQLIELQQELMVSLREQNRLTQENADLRVHTEKQAARIRDLERENMELRESKRASGIRSTRSVHGDCA